MLEILFLVGVIIVAGFAARLVFEKTRVPEAIVLLLLGFVLGPMGAIAIFTGSGIRAENFQAIAPFMGAVAIISLVLEAGLRLKVKEIHGDVLLSGAYSVLNIVACVALLSGILHFIIGWSISNSLVYGAILGGMSSFAAYSILPLVRATNKMRSMLYLEGTLSTIITGIIAIALMRYTSLGISGVAIDLAGTIFSLFSVSFILGLILGLLLLLALLHFKIRRPSPILLFAALLIIYYVEFVYLGGIGIISIAIIGFALANAEHVPRLLKISESFEVDESFRAFQGEISLFINTFFFVYLGLIFRVEQLNLNNIWAAATIVLGILIARTIVAAITNKFSRLQNHERFLHTIMIPRDILSATLATFIFIYPGSATMGIEIVCLTIAISTIVTSIGISRYERIFRETFLFSKAVGLKDGTKVIVRSFTRDDFGKLRQFFNRLVEEGAYIAIDQRVSLEEESKIDNESLVKMNKKEMIVWVCEYQNKLIARAVAEKMPKRERDNVSMSLYIAKEFRGLGLGTILIRMLIEESMKVFKPHNLYLTVYSDNKKAIKLYEREGFVKFGVLPDWMKYDEKYLDRVYMVYNPKAKRAKRK